AALHSPTNFHAEMGGVKYYISGHFAIGHHSPSATTFVSSLISAEACSPGNSSPEEALPPPS
ncbi:MAG: hypothetical protein ACRCVK_10890, partial [Aeromonas veronii]